MLDHHILFYVLDSKSSYMRVFYTAFVTMISAMALARQKYHWEEDSGQAWARGLWWLELVIMGSENLLFSSFVSSMCSGLQNVSRSSSNNQSLSQKSSSLSHRLLDFGGPSVIVAFLTFSIFKTVRAIRLKHSKELNGA